MTSAQQVFRLLQQRARARGLNTQQQLELYVHERLLARVAASAFASQVVLKGGMLLAALDVRDVTRDADFALLAIDNDHDRVRSVFTTIAGADLDDGVVFDTTGMIVETMREDAQYHGLRVRIPCALHAARLVAQADLSFGDPLTGHRRRVPSMLADDFEMLAYSLESVLAEKLVTMLARGDANTRDRDFGDVWLIGQRFEIDADMLIDDIQRTAEHRGLRLHPLADALFELGDIRDASWQRYRTRTRLDALPSRFKQVVDFCVAFADPVLRNETPGGTWRPAQQRWIERPEPTAGAGPAEIG